MGFVKIHHRCPLPWIEGHGDIWQCDICGRYWKSIAPGNPAYNEWGRAYFVGRKELNRRD